MRVPAVRVVGSKGKGSTARTLAAILDAAGYHVGVFSSPHIHHWCERIRIGERDILPAHLASVMARLAPIVETLRDDERIAGPDFFEVMLTAALLAFQEERADLAIVEAGIGGRGDATHCLGPILSILTTIEAEHLNIIGPTLTDVAREKAAVATAGVPLIVGPLSTATRQAVVATASGRGARLVMAARDFQFAATEPAKTNGYYSESGYGLQVSLTETLAWLPDCVGIAIAAARRLSGFSIQDHAINRGLVSVALPGRLQHLKSRPLIIADGAHTKASTRRLARLLAAHHERPLILVIACSIGHEPADWDKTLWAAADAIITTCADSPRSHHARDTARRIQSLGFAVAGIQQDPALAMAAATRRAGAAGLVCATGSVYTVACAQRFVACPPDKPY